MLLVKTNSGINFQGIILLLPVVVIYVGVTELDLLADVQQHVDNFDTQVRRLLASERLTETEITKLSVVFYDLEKTLQIQWAGSKVLPIGSLAKGLAMKSSDADSLLIIPHYNVYNFTANIYLINETMRLLKQQPTLYTDIKPHFREKHQTSLVTFTYVPTRRNCDVNFIELHGFYCSKMLAYYYSFDDRAFTIGFIIKMWSKTHGKFKKGFLTSYTLNLLVIFYLQHEHILPPYYLVENSLNHSIINQNWTKLYSNSKSKNVYQLLGGFFKYYSEFNFKEYVVSPLLGRPVHKKLFGCTNSLPDQLSKYKKYLKTPNSSWKKAMCIQDLFPPYSNAVEFPSSFLELFTLHVNIAAEKFKLLPRDKFLKSILVIDRPRLR